MAVFGLSILHPTQGHLHKGRRIFSPSCTPIGHFLETGCIPGFHRRFHPPQGHDYMEFATTMPSRNDRVG
ncbi:MAG: hypothetical protein ISR86_02220 [Nitrospinaceae bacterium]|nr:hypothetical protein [Nitrospinaceae bacterium]